MSSVDITAFLASSPDAQLSQIRSKHSDRFTFLGVEYNWLSITKGISQKTKDKLEAINDCTRRLGRHVTPRQLAAILGVLRYASHTTDHSPLEFYPLLRWARAVGSFLQADVARWDNSLIVLPPEHHLSLISWCELALSASFVPMAPCFPTQVPPTIISDASGDGWGAVFLHDEQLRTFRGLWRSHIFSSVIAEPRGCGLAVRQVMALFGDSPPPHVLILTDHLPLVHAANSQAPRAFPYNQLLLDLRTNFPSTIFSFSFLPGKCNLADGLSRGVDEGFNLDIDKARQFAGAGWLSALTHPQNNHLSPCAICSPSVRLWQC